MSDIQTLALVLIAGVFLGLFFFGGLWLTVEKVVTSERPAFWFLSSLLLRNCLTLAGFYFVAQGHWPRVVVCLLGFLIARVIVTKQFTRAAVVDEQTQMGKETTLAP